MAHRSLSAGQNFVHRRRKFGSVALAAILLFSTGALAAESPSGTVKLIKGEVFIQDAAAKIVADTTGKRGRTLSPGAPFYAGETIVTKADGRAKLEFVEGHNEVVLGTNTSLLIERAPSDPLKARGTSLSLARGEVRSTVNQKYSGKGTDSYEVKMPNAVAGVRGTVFTARFDAKTFKSEVATERGLVAVRGLRGGGEVVVRPGMFTAATGAAAVTQPAPISQNKDLEGAVKALSGNGEAKPSDENAAPSVEGGSADAGSDKPAPTTTADASSGEAPKSEAAPAAADKPADKPAAQAVASKESAPAAEAAPAPAPAASNDAPPLAREPVVASSSSASGRAPASVPTPGMGGAETPVMGVATVAKAAPPAPSAAAVVTDTLSRTTTTVQNATQTVNQQTQQAARLSAKLRFKLD